MGIDGEAVAEKLRKALNAETVRVVDQSDGCGYKFWALVVSEAFVNRPLLQRHRLVNEALNEELKLNVIHALSLKTLTPEEYKNAPQPPQP